MAALVIFDDGEGELAPATDLRACFEVRSGAARGLERVERALGARAEALVAPARIAGLVQERDARAGVDGGSLGDDLLLVNGRWWTPDGRAASLARGQALVERETGAAIAARMSGADAARLPAARWELPRSVERVEAEAGTLAWRAWDLIRFRDEALRADLDAMAREAGASAKPAGAHMTGDHPVIVRDGARVAAGVTLDTSAGAIALDRGAKVRAGAIVCGPAYVGEGSTVVERAHIKANTAIGPTCKVGGEVGGVIFQGLANKAHEGHLGDSWVGEWVNFGAGTTNSNLLNTYGEVSARVSTRSPRRRTGLTFLGAIVGDHVKFAILTRIMTGSVFGTGAMVATPTAPATVDAFGWLTEGSSAEWFRFEKFLETAQRVMARRGRTMTEREMEALRALHDESGPAR